MDQPTSTPSSFTVTCPGCKRRLRFTPAADGLPRMKIHCTACHTLFGVRRPGAPPAGTAGSPAGGAVVPAPTYPGFPVAAIGASADDEPTGALASRTPAAAGASQGAGSGSVAARAAGAPSFSPGLLIAGRYRVTGFIAQGGMGEVYEVEDLELRDRVALKTVRPEIAEGALAIDRFRREIQLSRKVTHPNVCRIFDVSHHRPADPGAPPMMFLTMELLRGETLAQRLRRGPLGPELLPIARQIAQGLDAAHQVGIVHRDLKPGNVLLVPRPGGPPRAVVTDFGLARLAAGAQAAGLTLTGGDGVVGTPAYLAPEQLEGGEVTPAVDVYAFGIVLYEMVSGTVPFLSDSVLATAIKRLKERPASPRVYAPDLDPRWERAILRCLERDPAARFAGCLDAITAATGEATAATGSVETAPEAVSGAAFRTGPASGATAGVSPGAAAAAATAQAGVAGAPSSAVTAAAAASSAPGSVSAGAASAAATSAPGSIGGGAASAGAAAPAGAAAAATSSASGLSAGDAASPAAATPAGRSAAGVSPAATSATAAFVPAASVAPSASGVPSAVPPGSATSAAPPPRRRLLQAASLAAIILLSFLLGYMRFRDWRARQPGGAEGVQGAGQDEAVAGAGLPANFSNPPRRAVAVIGFRDLSGSSASAWLSPALAEMLGAELAASGKLRIVASETVARAKLELKLDNSESFARDTLARLRTLVGADQMVLGSYVTLEAPAAGRQIRLDVRVQDAVAGETTAMASETGTEAELFSLVARVGSRLRRELGEGEAAAAAGGAPMRAAAMPAMPASPEAARYYAEGLERLRRFEPVAARDLLAKAVAADPRNAMAHSGLAAAWSALGFDGKQRDEAKTAFDLAAGLPQEERLAVEGRYRAALGDWGRAIDIYRRLWSLFPDNLEHGLRLAAAETAAGRTREALTTAAALHSLPPPARDDARIDLALATAAGSAGDFRRQREAADSAARKASAAGASLLVAEARLLACRALRNLGEAEPALAACGEGQRLYAAAGDRAGVAEALTHSANVRFDRGDRAGAQRLYEEALVTYRDLGNRGAEAGELNNIAVVLKGQGNLDRAGDLYRQVLAISREIGSRSGEAYALNNLAGVMLRRGDLGGAGTLLEQCLQIRRELEDRSGEAYALDNLGVALRRRGDLAGALSRHQAALGIRRQIGQKIGEVASLNNLGSTLLEQGDLAAASRSFDQALSLARAIGSQSSAAYALFGQGEVLARQGLPAAAEARHQAALGLRLGLGEKGTAAESRVALARLRLEAGDAARAGVLARQAAGELVLQGSPGDQALALSLAALADGALHEGESAHATLTRAAALAGGGQDLRARLVVDLRSALLRQQTDPVRAGQALAAVLAGAERGGLFDLRLEAGIALAQTEAARGQLAPARARLAAIEKEARERGFGLLAARAHDALAPPSA
jgi:tetratricopeptide (TPR) repeat protein/tRNA A-37 threonylcarbamoyl transferase component Bud32